MGKSCRLPFSLNNKIASTHLVKIHCDLWGPTPIASINNLNIMLSLWMITLAIHGCIH